MPKPGPAGGQPRLAGGLEDAGGHGVLVVLDEEADRQLPGGRQVERLQRRADVGRAVAEVGDRDGVGAGLPVRPGEPGRQRDAAADDGVGADRAGLLPLQVHRAAAAVAPAAVQPADLGQGAQQRRRGRRRRAPSARSMPLGATWCERLGEELVVAAVRAVDRVGAGQRERRADGAALLADARVRRAVDQPGRGELEHVLLERPDQHQLAEHRGEQLGVGGVPVVLGRRRAPPRGRPGPSRRCSVMARLLRRMLIVAACHGLDPFQRTSGRDTSACISMSSSVWIQCTSERGPCGTARTAPASTTSGSPCPTWTRPARSSSTCWAASTCTPSGPFVHEDSDWMAEHLNVHPRTVMRRTASSAAATRRSSRSSSYDAAGPGPVAAAQQRHRRPSRRALRRRPRRRRRPPARRTASGCSASRRRAGAHEGQRWVYFLAPGGCSSSWSATRTARPSFRDPRGVCA